MANRSPRCDHNSLPALRYPQLDWLRGLAICAILLMNIVSFALPTNAYLKPNWSGLASNADTWCWAVQSFWFENKFITLFALLFGAGLALQLSRKTQRQLRHRLCWLCVFGFAHFILLWEGDILLNYGLCGLVALPLIKRLGCSKRLIRIGLIYYLMGCACWFLTSLLSLSNVATSETSIAIQALHEQRLHSAATDYGLWQRSSSLVSTLVGGMLIYGWQLIGLMLIGAGLIKSGWLNGTGRWQPADYLKQCACFLLPAASIVLLQVAGQWQAHWQGAWSDAYLGLLGLLAAPVMTIGYVMFFLGCWPIIERTFTGKLFCSVGRMALSNYLLQSILATAIFSWFGGFMHFSRWQLLAGFVPLIISLNFCFSLLWLRYFQQGPLEWLWRKLIAFSTTHC